MRVNVFGMHNIMRSRFCYFLILDALKITRFHNAWNSTLPSHRFGERCRLYWKNYEFFEYLEGAHPIPIVFDVYVDAAEAVAHQPVCIDEKVKGFRTLGIIHT